VRRRFDLSWPDADDTLVLGRRHHRNRNRVQSGMMSGWMGNMMSGGTAP